jgi:hypothetical protein
LIGADVVSESAQAWGFRMDDGSLYKCTSTPTKRYGDKTGQFHGTLSTHKSVLQYASFAKQTYYVLLIERAHPAWGWTRGTYIQE